MRYQRSTHSSEKASLNRESWTTFIWWPLARNHYTDTLLSIWLWVTVSIACTPKLNDLFLFSRVLVCLGFVYTCRLENPHFSERGEFLLFGMFFKLWQKGEFNILLLLLFELFVMIVIVKHWHQALSVCSRCFLSRKLKTEEDGMPPLIWNKFDWFEFGWIVIFASMFVVSSDTRGLN